MALMSENLENSLKMFFRNVDLQAFLVHLSAPLHKLSPVGKMSTDDIMYVLQVDMIFIVPLIDTDGILWVF